MINEGKDNKKMYENTVKCYIDYWNNRIENRLNTDLWVKYTLKNISTKDWFKRRIKGLKMKSENVNK